MVVAAACSDGLLLLLQCCLAASAAVGPAGWSHSPGAAQGLLLGHRGCHYWMRQQLQVTPEHSYQALQLVGRPQLLLVADQVKLGADARLAALQPPEALSDVVGW